MTLPIELPTLIVAVLAVCAGYTVFGITAFGAALVTVPVLSHFYPLEVVLPVMVVVDVTAALAMGTRFSRDADIVELKWLAPTCVAGAVLGVTLLVNLPQHATMAAFAVFLLIYGAYTLRQPVAATAISRGWAPIAGIAGGVTGTLFGIGGPPYAIYLSRRIYEPRVLRATLANMVLLSVSIRLIAFMAGGLITLERLEISAVLAPFSLLGIWIGNRLHRRVSREGLLRAMSLLLLLMGASILLRLLAD